MDGYAVKLSALSEKMTTKFSLISPIYAGDSLPSEPESHLSQSGLPTAAYVTTGAVVPSFYDCVVPVEFVHAPSATNISSVTLSTYPMPANKNIRPPGSDIPLGSVLVQPNQLITPATVGLLATFGITSTTVYAPPTVGVISCGNELLHPADNTNHIHDSNRPSLIAYVQTLKPPAKPIDLGIAPDSLEHISRVLDEALHGCDVVVTSGGVSAGEKDLIAPALRSLGAEVHFSRLNLKPGKPTTFSTLTRNGKRKLVLSLPGNPVSCLVCASLFLAPILCTLSNGAFNFHRVVAVITEDVKLDKGRPEFHRVTLTYSKTSRTYFATSTGHQQSSKLLSMVGTGEDANGLLLLPAGDVPAKRGEEFECFVTGSVKEAKEDRMQVLVIDAPDDDAADRIIKLFGLSESGKGKRCSAADFDGVYAAMEFSSSPTVVVYCGGVLSDDSISSKVRRSLAKQAPQMEAALIAETCTGGGVNGINAMRPVACGGKGGGICVCVSAEALTKGVVAYLAMLGRRVKETVT